MPTRYPPEILTPDEVRRLLEACGTTQMGARHRALIALLYRSGLRVSEALALYPKDIEGGAVRVLRGKGGRSRTVGLDPGGNAIVGEWLDARAEMGLGPRAPLLCSREGHPMTASYVRRLFSGLGRAAGIDKRVHPHGLRHTHASELRAEGIDIGIISKQLGHRSIYTTAHYLDHIAPWAVVEAVQARVWQPESR